MTFHCSALRRVQTKHIRVVWNMNRSLVLIKFLVGREKCLESNDVSNYCRGKDKSQ